MNFDFDIRIPDALVQQMMNGEITCSMLVTMVILYKWSNWDTGIVRRVCASSLHHASGEAYSVRTFQDALLRLEKIGWITRQIIAGSHKWYPVLIHNYKWVGACGDPKCCPKPEQGDSGESARKVHILNPKNIKVSDLSASTICGERNVEGSAETSDETSAETSDSHKSLHELEHKSELEPEHQEELASLLVSQREEPSAPASEEQEQPRNGLGSVPEPTPTPEDPYAGYIAASPEVQAVIKAVGNDITVPALLGMPYFTTDHDSALVDIAEALLQRNRSVDWLRDLVKWAKQDSFWRKRLHTGDRGVAQLAKHLVSGQISEQFDANRAQLNPHIFDGQTDHANVYLWRDGVYEHYKRTPNHVPTMEERMAANMAKLKPGDQLMAGGKVIGRVVAAGDEL